MRLFCEMSEELVMSVVKHGSGIYPPNIRDDWPDAPPSDNKLEKNLLIDPHLQTVLFAPYLDEEEEANQMDAGPSYEEAISDIINSRILSVAQLLARDRVIKKAWTIQELLDSTSKRSIKYKSGCMSRLRRSSPKLGRWLFTVKCGQAWSEGPYNIRFRLLNQGRRYKDLSKRQIQISCNCDAWKYNGADYNALNKDYSERKYSDGSSPNIRDKRRKYLICKHVATCIPIISKYLIPKDFK